MSKASSSGFLEHGQSSDTCKLSSICTEAREYFAPVTPRKRRTNRRSNQKKEYVSTPNYGLYPFAAREYFAPVTPRKRRTNRRSNQKKEYVSTPKDEGVSAEPNYGSKIGNFDKRFCRLNIDFGNEGELEILHCNLDGQPCSSSNFERVPVVYERRKKAKSLIVCERSKRRVPSGDHSALPINDGAIVPYEEPVDLVNVHHPRGKVYIDEETTKVWKLLLEDIDSPGIDGLGEEDRQWWNEERARYHGLSDVFVSRMRLVQGHRQFSPWKGSVVDSVVGAFLTQNVSDLYSSSAFMMIASHFQTKPNMDDGMLRSTMDSVNWEAARNADVNYLSEIIKERGMNVKLAERIQDFLNCVVRDHGSIDLEWLRDLAPDKAKEYLLSIYGMGLKSVECIRLLTLHQRAFPVDTNVARVAVRLGWVPLQPLPDDTQLHLLTQYPDLKTIQVYLWPRLCKLDQRTLYELHYQMITFGKVFCTKRNPNCNACPMRGDCKYYASALDSSRLPLRGCEDERTLNAHPEQLQESQQLDNVFELSSNSPIVEFPDTPEPEQTEAASENDTQGILLDIEDMLLVDIEEDQQEYTQHQDWEMSQALVALTPEVASIPLPKLKNVNKLRTQHQVYELPDSHPLLIRLEKRDPEDPCNYLLAVWSPDYINKLKNNNTCFSSNNSQEADSQTILGTLLIPCRTAMRGSFPLNGTYFQVNEVFADHESSINPISVHRDSLWNLPRRTVYFGTSISSIFKRLSTEEIQRIFWRGCVCLRGFDCEKRAPRPLEKIFHFSPGKEKRSKSKKTSEEASSSSATKSKKTSTHGKRHNLA